MLIGVDHGNKQIKTVHCAPFVSGLQQSMTRPFGPSLQYGGNYYTLSQRAHSLPQGQDWGRPLLYPHPDCDCRGIDGPRR